MTRTRLRDDPSFRLSIYLSLTFAAAGAGMPFLPRWLEQERGLTGLEIGAVLSAAALVRILVAPLIAAAIEGVADRSRPLRWLAASAALAYVAFWMGQGFWALLVAAFAASTLAAALTPIAEGAILRASSAGRLPYGVGRAMASAAFVVGNVAGGALVLRFGPDVAVLWVIASYAAAALVGFSLRPDPAPAAAAGLGYRARLRQIGELLRNPRYVLIIVGCGLIQSGHAFYYGFSTLVWSRQGIDAAFAGALWALGVIVEIGFLAALPWIERRVRPEVLVLAGAGASVVRWLALAAAPPALALLPLQALHALTFAAAHVGALRLVQRETPEQSAASGQMLYAALASGTLMGGASIAAGALYDAFGAGGYVASAALALAGGGLIVQMMRTAAKTGQT
ncbi:MAG: MFS transporter [Alphaproteobacteria bacterium]|nr:MFS transporter [Alphaproteobacteria bacterium]